MFTILFSKLRRYCAKIFELFSFHPKEENIDDLRLVGLIEHMGSIGYRK